jgi:nucleoside-diphosphate-sugar epimerase
MIALVTGGGGFLGKRLVELLRSQNHEVRFIARHRYPDVEALGALGVVADLRDAGRLEHAMRGCEVVFHVAARVGVWGPRHEYVSTNIVGTRNVLQVARASGVSKLIYTSTPSVIGYERDVAGIEHAPYPRKHCSIYPETKAVAERMVLDANSRELATVALRPHLVFGPGDQNLLPSVVRRAREGRAAMVGDGKNLVDMTYIDNAAWAHLDAERALTDSHAPCAGRAYFISNDCPVNMWDWTNDFLRQVGVPTISRRIPLDTAIRIGTGLEWVWRTFKLRGEPRMTRFLASALGRSHWYSMEPARRELGYRIRVPMEAATTQTIRWWLSREAAGASAI